MASKISAEVVVVHIRRRRWVGGVSHVLGLHVLCDNGATTLKVSHMSVGACWRCVGYMIEVPICPAAG